MQRENQVTPAEAFDMQRRGEAVEIIDVRETQEYRDTHVQPSRLIPLNQLPARLHELDRTRTLLMLCRSGSRSVHAARELATYGFETRNIAGGILAWIAAGLPVRKGN
ncbi:MAG TPA: rhodanese-like domain-containing protein [Thermoanaerobaculia bacterium]|nr:rhodanese-like domain-containing protein [Thermoanaerobaculia bacterium]